MKIKKIKLSNFQGIKGLEITTDGNTTIYGDNGTGKTTIANAISWVLFGCGTTDEKNYDPKTVGEHQLNHIAELEAEHNGREFKLKKDFHEVYRTKRGSAEAVFSGHTCDCYFDEVLMSEKEYTDRVRNLLADIDTMKILSDPFYFCTALKIADRRNILIEKIGGVTDSDVIAQNPQYIEVPELLAGKTVEDFLKIQKVNLSNIDKEVKSIPNRIDEAKKAMPEVTAGRAELESQKQELEVELAELINKMNSAGGTATTELQGKISELKLELKNAELKHVSDINVQNSDTQKTIDNLRDKSAELKRDIASKKSEVEILNFDITSKTNRRLDLLEEYKKINGQEWQGDTVCPTCGQKLPQEQIESAKSKFNLDKANRLEEIKKQGEQCSFDIINKMKGDAEVLRSQIKTIEEQEYNACKQALDLESKKLKADFTNTQEYKNITAEIERYAGQLNDVKTTIKNQNKEINQHIADAKSEINNINSQLAQFDLIARQESRIDELRAQQDNLQTKAEEIKCNINLVENFQRDKMNMLSEVVNSEFNNIKFRMFENQINGGIKDACEPLIPCKEGLIPFDKANFASKVNAGLEIIGVLGRAYGLQMPIVIDGAESITDIKITTNAQLISLIVSAKDKKLRVERG